MPAASAQWTGGPGGGRSRCGRARDGPGRRGGGRPAGRGRARRGGRRGRAARRRVPLLGLCADQAHGPGVRRRGGGRSGGHTRRHRHHRRPVGAGGPTGRCGHRRMGRLAGGEAVRPPGRPAAARPRPPRRSRPGGRRRGDPPGPDRTGRWPPVPAPVVPEVPGLADTPFWTNRGAVAARQAPTSLVVLGGGAVGVELAQVFHRFGTAVTIVDPAPRLLGGEEPEAADLLAQVFADEGIGVRTSTEVTSVYHDGGRFTLLLSGAESITGGAGAGGRRAPSGPPVARRVVTRPGRLGGQHPGGRPPTCARSRGRVGRRRRHGRRRVHPRRPGAGRRGRAGHPGRGRRDGRADRASPGSRSPIRRSARWG